MNPVDVYLASEAYYQFVKSIKDGDFDKTMEYYPNSKINAVDFLVNDKILIPAILRRDLPIIDKWLSFYKRLPVGFDDNNILYQAVENNDLEIVKLIMEKCPTSISTKKGKYHPTLLAYTKKNKEMFLTLVERYPVDFKDLDQEYQDYVRLHPNPSDVIINSLSYFLKKLINSSIN